MALTRPTLFYNFAESHYLDQRLAFSRASAGSYADKLGVLRYRPAGAPRFWSNSNDGSPLGLLLEDAATNLLLWSEAFDNAAWTNVGSAVAANTLTAPDGNATADNLVAVSSASALSQAVTVPANNGVAFSVFARANGSNFISLSLNDGTNLVNAWFNLAAGTTGSHSVGAGTLVFQASSIQAWGGGWYRCGLQVMATGMGLTASLSPCASDGGLPSPGNMAGIWGAMLTAEGTLPTNTRQSSYIGTTGATVTRAADNCPLPYAKIDASHFNPNEGTYFFDFVIPTGTWKAFNTAGFGFANSTGTEVCQTGLLVGNQGVGKGQTLTLQTALIAGGVLQAYAASLPSFAFDAPIKFAARYSATALLGQSVNGGAVVSAAALPTAMPAIPTNFTLSPFNAWAVNSANGSFIIRRFKYFPRYLSVDQMQQLTA